MTKGATKTQQVRGDSCGQTTRFGFVATLCVTLLSNCAPVPVAAADLDGLLPLCMADGLSFQDRTAGIEQLGYTIIPTRPALWLEGQLLHIALAELQFSGPNADDTVRATYDSFRLMADAGSLFRTDTTTVNLTNPAQDIVIELALVDGQASCSIAFATGQPAPNLGLPVYQSWTQTPGSYSLYRVSGGGIADMSTFTSIWNDWINGGQTVGSFVVIGQ